MPLVAGWVARTGLFALPLSQVPVPSPRWRLAPLISALRAEPHRRCHYSQPHTDHPWPCPDRAQLRCASCAGCATMLGVVVGCTQCSHRSTPTVIYVIYRCVVKTLGAIVGCVGIVVWRPERSFLYLAHYVTKSLYYWPITTMPRNVTFPQLRR